jgi:hypothetical protein
MANGKKLEQLRILPPMVIARFGSSPTPMENFDVRIPRDQNGVPNTNYREVVPAETLFVDDASGAITKAGVPDQVRFRDAKGRIKPISPFLEVWALFAGSDELVPLTIDHLSDLGLKPADLVWRTRAANLKVFRRTGKVGDKVEADTGAFSGHDAHALTGRADNFKPGKGIPFGHVRVVEPTPEFPEIRVRFTPGRGLVFGPRSGDPLTNDDVYAGATADNLAGGAVRGRWDRYYIGNPRTPPVTAPADIFQGEEIGVRGGNKLSSGYFDDTCDGIVDVSLAVGGDVFTAYGRFASAVPDFAPDSLPVRSIADDLEQMALGPAVDKPVDDAGRNALAQDIQDILRRALDTQRQMNTVALNGKEPVADVDIFRNNMPGQENGSYNRKFEPIFGDASYAGALGVHKDLLETAIGSADVANAFAGRFNRVRQPEDIANLENPARMLMPAMMRGNEGLELALTRRQIAKLALADPTAQPIAAVAPAAALTTDSIPSIDLSTVNRPIRQRVRVEGEG